MFRDPDIATVLEPGQLTAATRRPLPRRRLGRGTVILLVLLRAYILIALPIVAYAFVHALHVPH